MISKSSHGRIHWITGLAGAGKTTIGNLMYERLKKDHPNLVFLDGDRLREIFCDPPFSYNIKQRLELSMKYAKLCSTLSTQGINVICATISMFDECRKWNRSHCPNYFEVYIRVPMPILIKRDQKQLYSKAIKGQIKDVMGLDLPFEEPKTPDLIIENDGKKKPQEICDDILQHLPT